MDNLFNFTPLRAIIGFLLLLILTRLLGKKQIGQITLFTYITGIAMGNIAGDMVVHKDITIIDGVSGLVIWAMLTIIVEYISLKSTNARVLLDGEPTIVIKKGQIIKDALKSLRLNIDDLTMLLRINNVFSIKEVEYAIYEPNGQLSVLKNPDTDTPVKKDFNFQTESYKYLPSEIISDGKLVKRNLKELNIDQKWVEQQLLSSGINSIEKVFYAEIQKDGSLYISKNSSCDKDHTA
jgi:uncharacterized membrane protein YcaP (DUF421 family)